MLANHLAQRLSAAKEKYWTHFDSSHAPDLNPYNYATLVFEGRRPVEHVGGFCIIRPHYTEIIPLDFRMPQKLGKQLRKKNFTFTTNQLFDEVVEQCAASRPECTQQEEYWIFERMKRNLRILRKAGIAHSLEVYSGNDFVGGAVVLAQKGILVSLTTFHRQSGAGFAGYMALQSIACQGKYLLHDALTPSVISTTFGGQLVNQQDAFMMRRQATLLGRECVFPVFAHPVVLQDFIQHFIAREQRQPTLPSSSKSNYQLSCPSF